MRLVTGPDGGVVWVHGMATFAWDAGDEAGRRLAAVGLCSPRLRAATQEQVAAAFGVIPLTVWRWARALERARMAELVPAGKGAAAGVEADPAGGGADRGAGRAGDETGLDRRGRAAGSTGSPPLAGCRCCPVRVPRDGERALARWGLLGEGAVPVFAPRARYPLAGLLLALPALEGAGLLDCARATYGCATGSTS